MIYFDNGATSRPKPEEVYDAFNYYVREVGTSPGRGSYNLAVQASRMLYKSRKVVCRFFDCAADTNVVFTKNSTEAMNLFFNGFLNTGDHVLISPFEHNAVLRPLETLKRAGIITYTVLPIDAFHSPEEHLKKYIKPETKLIAFSLASNLTGEILFDKEIAKIAHNCGIKVFLDASQGGGKKIISMKDDGIDYLAFTGHKDLLALPGVGGLVSNDELNFKPLIQGGTGVYGDNYVNPDVYPEAYESGTLNMPAIWSLKTSIEYIEKNINEIREKEKYLITYLIEKLKENSNVVLYKPDVNRVATVSFNIKNCDSSNVVEYLGKHDICVRGGIHCAILSHTELDTVSIGAVRVSLNHFNTKKEIDTFIKVIEEYEKCI